MILSVFADYFIYVFLMLVLALRTYRSINVLRSKTVINKTQFWVYLLTLLAGSFLLAIDQGLHFFRIVATVIFVITVVMEAKGLGKAEVIWQGKDLLDKEIEEKGRRKKDRPAKKTVPPALKSARMDFFLTAAVALLSFFNIFGIWTSLLKGF